MCFSSIVIGFCTTDHLPAAALRTTEGFECEGPLRMILLAYLLLRLADLDFDITYQL